MMLTSTSWTSCRFCSVMLTSTSWPSCTHFALHPTGGPSGSLQHETWIPILHSQRWLTWIADKVNGRRG